MILHWLLTVLCSVIIGVTITLFLQYYFYKKYFSDKECPIQGNRVTNEPLVLPKVLGDLIRNSNISPSDSCIAVNLLLQFLFHELRDTERVRRWFRKKLSLEFEQLLAASAIGRMIANIKIREIHLGTEFPLLTNIGVQDVKINQNYSHIDTLDLKLDLSYSGNFRLVIEVVLLGKSAHVSVTVNELYGEGRLQFSRLPYSHWSFTFYSEPKLQLDVVSQFQGRAYHQITTLISNQIRRALRRKHTLPNYKLRYKPFFDVNYNESKVIGIKSGELNLNIHRITRLNEELASNREIYVLAGTDYLPWVEIRNYRNCNFFLLNITITKRSQMLGVSFKHNFVEEKDGYCLVVTEIKHGMFDNDQELQLGDIVISLEGKKVTSLNQLNKLLRSMPTQFNLRIERRINKLQCEEVAESNATTLTTPPSDCPIYSGLRRRRGSESESCSSTPSTSMPGSPARRTYFRSPQENTKPVSSASQDVAHRCDDLCQKLVKSKCLTYDQVLIFDEVFNLNVKSDERYVNVNVRAKETENQRDVLLGFINIPLSCLESAEDDLKSLFLKPPDILDYTSRSHKLSCQNGFNPSLCYGDIVCSFQLTHPLEIPVSPISTKVQETIDTQLPASDNLDILQDSIVPSDRKHDFVRTHFSTSTKCEFCGRKIWWKEAERCRECGMSVHKKCVAKCLVDSVCLPQTLNSKLACGEIGSGHTSGAATQISFTIEDFESSTQTSPTKPETTMTGVEDVTPQSTPKRGFSGLLANVASRSLKRVGSANNLVLPGGQFPPLQSKSLPPSPQQSPAPSRKPSLPTDLNEEISSVLETLMQQGSNHGDLMYFAKESGKTLYEELDLAERKEKIHDMINKLKSAINDEVEARFSLEKEEQELKDPTEKAKVAFLIGKSDEKTQALTILMLHFCSGLQHIQDLEEKEKEIGEVSDIFEDSSPLT